jgi:hypothetical protein
MRRLHPGFALAAEAVFCCCGMAAENTRMERIVVAPDHWSLQGAESK